MDTYKNIGFSIIIPSYNSANTIRTCLNSVLEQRTKTAYEVIVVDSSSDETASIIERDYPAVKLIKFDSKTDPGTARNAGVKVSAGDVIVFTDSDCIVPEDWIDKYKEAYLKNDNNLIIGGAIVNGNPETLVSIAGYMIEFSDNMPTVPGGEVLSIPTCNISYKKSIFKKYGGYHSEFYPQEDYYFHWKLNKAGEKIVFSPDIQIKHFHREKMSEYLKHQIRFGNITAQVLKITDLPGHFFVKRWWLAPLFLPFLPLIKMWRTSKRVICYAPRIVFKELVIFPIMFLGLMYWWVGFVKGIYSIKK